MDWSRISPAIFDSLFQFVMDTALRRNLGPHYTTEKNILKLKLDAVYAKRKFTGDSDRVAFLFELYQQIATRLNSGK